MPESEAFTPAVRQGEHVCLIYEDDPGEHLPTLLELVRDGLEQGEQCVYLASDEHLAQVSSSLAAHGVDVAALASRGALQLSSRRLWEEADFHAEQGVDRVRRIIEDALAAGFAGVRFAIDMTWELKPRPDLSALPRYEALLNTLLVPEAPARILCQYGRGRLAPTAVCMALHTHPLAIVGADRGLNPYSEAALILADAASAADADEARVDWMLDQLQRLRSQEKERERYARIEGAAQAAELARQSTEELYRLVSESAESLRRANVAKEDFLGVVSHELRTPLTTILGGAELLRRLGSALSPDERLAAATDIEQEATRLQHLMDDFFALARIDVAESLAVEPVLPRQVIRRVVAAQAERHLGRAIIFTNDDVNRPVAAEAAYLEQVVWNMLQDALERTSRTTPVQIDLKNEDGESSVSVRLLEVRDDSGGRLTPVTATRGARGELAVAALKLLVEAQRGRFSDELDVPGVHELRVVLPAVHLDDEPPTDG